MEQKIKDADYFLEDGAAWLRVKNFAIRIHATDEGVIVDVFKNGSYDDFIATTYAFDHETQEDF